MGNLIGCGASSNVYFMADCGLPPPPSKAPSKLPRSSSSSTSSRMYRSPSLKMLRSSSKKRGSSGNKISPMPPPSTASAAADNRKPSKDEAGGAPRHFGKLCSTEELRRCYLKLTGRTNRGSWKPKLETIDESVGRTSRSSSRSRSTAILATS